MEKLLIQKENFINLIDGSIIKEGEKIIGSINGEEMEGIFHYGDGNIFYFLQNSQNGSTPPGDALLFYNMKYSWQFTQTVSGNFTEGVIINPTKIPTPGKRKFVKLFKHQGSKNFLLSLQLFEVIVDNDLRRIVRNTPLFKFTNHPDCCGLHNLYQFSVNKELISKLTESLYKDIIDSLVKINKGMLMVTLSHRQIYAKEFIEKLGFNKLQEFKNPNSKNDVTIYTRFSS